MSTYRELLETLDEWFDRGRAAAGAGVVPCRSSCSACCHGVFDISAADAQLVAEGLAQLSDADAAGLRSRATDQLQRCAELLQHGPDDPGPHRGAPPAGGEPHNEDPPAWGPPWDVDALSEEVFDALTEKLARSPCPALTADGGCAVYTHRPATCRMTGLAMDAGRAGRLDNECPIQFDFPRYVDLAPVAFDLITFEQAAARHDALSAAQGAVTTTVAGAILTGSRSRES